MNAAEDPVAVVLGRPLVEEPGSTFNDSWGLTQVLVAVVEEPIVTAAGHASQRVILVPELGLSVTMFAGLYDTSDPEEIWMPDRLLAEGLPEAVEE